MLPDDSSYDMYNITRPEHVVSVSRDVIADIALGSGLNMNDPLKPMPAFLGPFGATKPAIADTPIDLPSILIPLLHQSELTI
jgi:hypothetical protein